MKLGEAIAKQENTLEALKKTNINMRKKGLKKGNVESYLKGLESRWEEIRTLDTEIEKVKTTENASLPYFDGWMETAEDEFLEQRGLLFEAFYECEAASRPATEQSNSTTLPSRTYFRKLPHMELPKFSGNYTQWAFFKDLFLSMVSDEELTDVDRMHFLKASLSGEAAQLIKNLQVTSDNYTRAWTKLKDQYENTRLIVNSCLNSLLQMPPLLKESEQGLNALRGTTSDIREILTALKRPVDHWDDFFIYLTVQRLNPKSRRDWETSVANTSAPSTSAELEKFLTSRIQAIEHGQESLLQSMASHAPNKAPATNLNSGKVSVHNTIQQSAGAECKFCTQGHYIGSCDSFKALDVSSRKEFMMNNRLCYNCLGSHGVRDCRSKRTCYHCHGRHHSLLHFSNNTNLSNNRDMKMTANAMITPTSHEIHKDKEQTEGPHEQTINVLTSSSSAPDNRSLTLMATAQIIVAINGRKVLLRALIDPCLDASFIKESMVQLLHAHRRPASVSVGGIGGAGGVAQRVKYQVSVHISPRHQMETIWPVSALVLPKLTDYLLPRHAYPLTWNFSRIWNLQILTTRRRCQLI